MEIRNSCIYTDVDLHSKVIDWPAKNIKGDHPYYFIPMYLEIIAKESDAGFGLPFEELESENGITEFQTANEFEDQIFWLLSTFMAQYQEEFDESNLEFFTQHPQYDSDREKVRENEVRMNDERRNNLEEIFRTFIEESEEPSEEDKEKLPEGISHKEYQEQILEGMLDIGMDMPYFTDPGMHPDLRDLRKHVMNYLKYVED